ncbi:MAG: glycoside hydrolase family 20 protein [Bacteroidota bacterium]|nr:glycoside hydrolase family 20 protein [Bacteroidota bacterium]
MNCRNVLPGLFILVCTFVFSSCEPNKTFTESELALIPQPQKMILGESSFKFKKNTRLVVESVDQKVIADGFSDLFEKASGYTLDIIVGGDEGSNQVYFRTEPVMAPEAYSLEVSENRIEIKAAKPAGFYYAVQTLRQLLPIEIEGALNPIEIEWLVPAVSISDSPAFRWRGFMLDVSRHFFPKEDVLRMIDHLAIHKINTLHLHLVDDQGWRIEIKKYPKLTEAGAWRVDREDKHWNARPKQEPGETATYGGFYTQEDIKEMVVYAQSRFVTIVPEIELPAHVTSALAAYPQYSCTGGPFTVLPGGVWPITDIYCAGKDSTFMFLEDVLTEVINLFPSKYIHIGGDEATKTEWEKCPDCRKRVKTEGLKDMHELQSYFIKRMEKFLHSRGKVLLGWDEILEGGLPAEATVMSWRGFQGGIDAANQGHDVVMTPNSHCYIDYYQGPMDQEPLAIGGYLPLSKVYNFNPVPEELSADAAKHILGGQANLWTEYVPDLKHAEYMTFPRIAALAEAVWSPKEVRNWENFSRRIQLFLKRYDQMGINYSKSAYKVSAKTQFDPEKKQLTASLSSEFSGIEIHYTTDGSEPTNLSSIYSEPIMLDKSSTLKAITFANGIPYEKPFSQSFNINKATVKPVKYRFPFSENYEGSGKYTLVNGIRGTSNHHDGEWQGWSATNMEVVIDLQQATEIHSISVGSLQNAGAYIFFPKKMEFFVSEDGVRFQKVAEVLNDVNPLSGEKQLKDFSASFNPIPVSFVKIVSQNLGRCPKGHVGEGKPAWMFIDEIAVE